MKKQYADQLILQYQNKIFGFALEKMRNISQAEELASNIVCEVYKSFLNAENIINTDGYVYRIARNVYARYIHILNEGKNFENINEITMPFYDDGFYKQEMRKPLPNSDGRSDISHKDRELLFICIIMRKNLQRILHRSLEYRKVLLNGICQTHGQL